MCQQDINHVWTFLCASRTSTMSRLFYVTAGHQPCLDFLYVPTGHQPCLGFFFNVPAEHQPCMGFFFYVPAGLNHVWTFLCANRTSTMSRLFLMRQQDINHIWTFLCASKTSTMSRLFYVPAGHQPCLDFFFMEAIIGFQRKCQKDNLY